MEYIIDLEVGTKAEREIDQRNESTSTLTECKEETRNVQFDFFQSINNGTW